jgi:tetraacyldisaccharide 4'-kinase
LREAGYKPGVVSRGYGGQSREWPCSVTASSNPYLVGDEPVLLAQRCQCPVVVGPDRVAAAMMLFKTYDCNMIISDDGLQHYRLKRDIEIAVVDGFRRLGNAACLPAGPLREPPSRLREVDFVVGNGVARGHEYLMSLKGDTALNLEDPCISSTLASFRQCAVHAVAGISDPWRFFEHLRRSGLRLIEHPFPDHYAFSRKDLQFRGDFPILMTEKDAIKCRGISLIDCWYVPVNAQLDPEFEEQILKKSAIVAMAQQQSISG